LRRTNVDALRVSVHALRVNVHALRVNVRALRVNVHALCVNVHALRVNVHALRVNVRALRVNVHALRVNVCALRVNVDRRLRDLEKHPKTAVIGRKRGLPPEQSPRRKKIQTFVSTTLKSPRCDVDIHFIKRPSACEAR